MNNTEFRKLVVELYSLVDKFEQMFPGRHFTPDGHMIGSIGECLVAEAYGLTLETAGKKGYDARAPDGTKVEIKATQGNRVAFNSCPDHAIVIKVHKDGSFDTVYNGLGTHFANIFDKDPSKTGQYHISLSRLASIQKANPNNEITRIA